MGIGHSLALAAGCTLVNMEFMQMMPGYITPAYKTVFNEKVFRFTRFSKADGSPLLTPEEAELLEIRSTHGPFTARLSSKAVDISLFREFMANERGCVATYCEEMKENPPEFVKVYFDWLLSAKGVSVDDPIHVGIFAHAANGGIRIWPDASTGVPGLFAAGEVTGGMHGADRIGGLSTANGLVVGTIAGESAAVYAHSARTGPDAVEYETFAAGDLAEQLKICSRPCLKTPWFCAGNRAFRKRSTRFGSCAAALPPPWSPPKIRSRQPGPSVSLPGAVRRKAFSAQRC